METVDWGGLESVGVIGVGNAEVHAEEALRLNMGSKSGSRSRSPRPRPDSKEKPARVRGTSTVEGGG